MSSASESLRSKYLDHSSKQDFQSVKLKTPTQTHKKAHGIKLYQAQITRLKASNSNHQPQGINLKHQAQRSKLKKQAQKKNIKSKM